MRQTVVFGDPSTSTESRTRLLQICNFVSFSANIFILVILKYRVKHLKFKKQQSTLMNNFCVPVEAKNFN